MPDCGFCLDLPGDAVSVVAGPRPGRGVRVEARRGQTVVIVGEAPSEETLRRQAEQLFRGVVYGVRAEG